MTTNRRAFLGLLAAAPVVAKTAVVEHSRADWPGGWNYKYYPADAGSVALEEGWTEIRTVRMAPGDWIKGTASRGDEVLELFYRADPASVPILRATAPNRLFGVELNENGEAV